MVYTLPLALVAIGSFHTLTAFSILRYILQTMLVIALKTITVSTIIEVASYELLCLWRDSIDRVNRLTHPISHHLTERT